MRGDDAVRISLAAVMSELRGVQVTVMGMYAGKQVRASGRLRLVADLMRRMHGAITPLSGGTFRFRNIRGWHWLGLASPTVINICCGESMGGGVSPVAGVAFHQNAT